MNARHLTGSALSKWALGLCAVSLGVAAHAHITVSPKESKLGKQETYTFTIPTEGSVATTGVEIDVPPEVTIISIGGDPASYSVKKDGDRVVMISWTVNIPPGGGQQVTLVARNPTVPTRRLRWNAHQLFADGTRTSWSELPPAKPAPLVRMLAE